MSVQAHGKINGKSSSMKESEELGNNTLQRIGFAYAKKKKMLSPTLDNLRQSTGTCTLWTIKQVLRRACAQTRLDDIQAPPA